MLMFGVLFPMGIGIIYWVPVICAWEWFPERKGMISGLIIGAYGFGPFVFSFVSTGIVNPDNVSPEYIDNELLVPQEVANRIPGMWRWLLISWIVLLVVGISLVSRNPIFIKK